MKHMSVIVEPGVVTRLSREVEAYVWVIVDGELVETRTVLPAGYYVVPPPREP